MDNRICIINCYFGKEPKNLDLFLNSCKYNSFIDWLLVTDFMINNLPNNVININMSLVELKALIETKVGFQIMLEAPYKCCDYKIACRLIFEDYLKGYDFWGYSDFYIIYGNLKKFFDRININNYDKIFPLGHLSILKNNEDMKYAFMLESKESYSYKEVFTSNKTYGMDYYSGLMRN